MVANITRRDITEFLNLAAEMKLKPEIQVFTLQQANEALFQLKTGYSWYQGAENSLNTKIALKN